MEKLRGNCPSVSKLDKGLSWHFSNTHLFFMDLTILMTFFQEGLPFEPIYLPIQGFELETREYLSDFASVPSMHEHVDILGDSDLWVLTNASQDVNCSEHQRDAGWGHLGSHPSNGDAQLPGESGRTRRWSSLAAPGLRRCWTPHSWHT